MIQTEQDAHCNDGQTRKFLPRTAKLKVCKRPDVTPGQSVSRKNWAKNACSILSCSCHVRTGFVSSIAPKICSRSSQSTRKNAQSTIMGHGLMSAAVGLLQANTLECCCSSLHRSWIAVNELLHKQELLQKQLLVFKR